MTLLSPGVNILGVNASYLLNDTKADLEGIRARHQERNLPPLIALSALTCPLPGTREVARLRLGRFTPQTFPDVALQPAGRSQVLVEQVSRLHLADWSRVLAQTHGTPDWAQAIARHLAQHLEAASDYVLLLAYEDAKAVGGLLWREGNAHLWGANTTDAAQTLLQTAFELSGQLTFSARPDSGCLPHGTAEVVYALLNR